MLNTIRAYRGMVVAPHHLAAQAGADVLRDGGNAIKAMVAAASTIAVVYPHMNGLGGDNFWLLQSARPGSRRDRRLRRSGGSSRHRVLPIKEA